MAGCHEGCVTVFTFIPSDAISFSVLRRDQVLCLCRKPQIVARNETIMEVSKASSHNAVSHLAQGTSVFRRWPAHFQYPMMTSFV